MPVGKKEGPSSHQIICGQAKELYRTQNYQIKYTLDVLWKCTINRGSMLCLLNIFPHTTRLHGYVPVHVGLGLGHKIRYVKHNALPLRWVFVLSQILHYRPINEKFIFLLRLSFTRYMGRAQSVPTAAGAVHPPPCTPLYLVMTVYGCKATPFAGLTENDSYSA